MKTIVTTSGKVIQQGDDGVTIVDDDGKPILDVYEISDAETINVFLSPQGENTSGIVENDSLDNTWEILRNRKG
jgi:hypothetical protein